MRFLTLITSSKHDMKWPFGMIFTQLAESLSSDVRQTVECISPHRIWSFKRIGVYTKTESVATVEHDVKALFSSWDVKSKCRTVIDFVSDPCFLEPVSNHMPRIFMLTCLITKFNLQVKSPESMPTVHM
jgi:hypothetical protein